MSGGRTTAGGFFATAFVRAILAAIALSRCDLPHGNDDLPKTDVPGVNRSAVLRLLAAQHFRRAGAVVPITVEVTLASSGMAPAYCIRLAGEPGHLAFPFGDACGQLPDAGATSARDVAPVSDMFSQVRSCLRPSGVPGAEQSATLVAAYLPDEQESTATLFGALYGNAGCSGEALASTAVVLQLSGAATPAADAGAPPSDAAADAADNGGSP